MQRWLNVVKGRCLEGFKVTVVQWKKKEMKRDETNMELEFLTLSLDCCEVLEPHFYHL